MEKNIVVIDIERYESLLKANESLKQKLDELTKECAKVKIEHERVDTIIVDKIYKNNSWELSNYLKEEDDYYKKQIIIEFNNWGYFDAEFIDTAFDEIVGRYRKEHEKEGK